MPPKKILRFIKAIWAGGNQGTRNPFTVAAQILGVTSFPELFEAPAICQEEPLTEHRTAPAKVNMEAGSEAFSFGSSASLTTRNVYVGSFSSDLKQHTQINQPTKQPSTEILEIARRLLSANYFMGQPFSVSVQIQVRVTSRHLSIPPLNKGL